MAGDIQLKDLTVYFRVRTGCVRAVDQVSVTFSRGHITGLIGESGCGKSVLGSAILGLNPSYARRSGQVLLDGRDLLALRPRQMRVLRGRVLGLIPQDPGNSLDPSRRILGQIAESLALTGLRRPEWRRRAGSLLEQFGFSGEELERVFKSYPFQLSGGMQQRAAAAMGVASEPEWIIADEPSKGLDMALREQMYQTLRKIRENNVDSMLIITHDLLLAETLCDTLCVMYSGQIVEMGTDVLKSPMHPYTQGLLRSLPENGFQCMRGIAPSPSEMLPGCKFAPRCPYAAERCFSERPEFYSAGAGKARCFLYA